jgi:hypothetical protein
MITIVFQKKKLAKDLVPFRGLELLDNSRKLLATKLFFWKSIDNFARNFMSRLVCDFHGFEVRSV